ncbi:MAG: PEP-CTERM sorting domain-containing protein, partial [Armatimonadetes bacterium]|nr:PEP-CTERM sorting domain-containing protein [Armatimonadota bacterium]
AVGNFGYQVVVQPAVVVPETNTLALLAFGVAPIVGTVIARRRKK